MGSVNEMNEQLFLDTILEEYNAGQRYCFVLGAGASRASGIRTGQSLMLEWREYLLDGERGDGYIAQCAKKLGLKDEEYSYIFEDDYELKSEDYFTLFDLRFATKPSAAYAYLEREMEGKNPSLGYYYLSALLTKTNNRVVITTNFDSLTEDAVFYCTGRHPLVVGHESLAPFINTVRRPVVAKIHRDLLFRPMNRGKEMARLKNEWKAPLVELLSKYIPIVIGYSGGDQTFMSLLDELDLPGIFWCSTSGTIRDEKIRRTIAKNNGYLVKITGFDEIMFQLGERFQEETKFNGPCEDMMAAAQTRCDRYTKMYESIVSKYSDQKQQRDNSSGKATPRADAQVNMAKALSRYNDQLNPSDDPQHGQLLLESIIESIKGNYERALDLCTQCIALSPSRSDGYNRRSTIYHKMGRYDEALADANKAIELEPDNAELYCSRGITLHEMGRYDEALVDANKAIELEPTNARFYNSRGITLHEIGRYDEALADKSKAIELEPTNASFYDSRCVTLYELDRYDEALDDANKAIELEPTDARFYNSRCATLHKMGRRDETLADANKAIELEPNNAMFYNNRGVTLHEMGRYNEALADKSKAIELEPNNAKFYDSRSTTYHEKGLYDEALTDANRAIELEPNNARFYNSRSATYHEKGLYDEALTDANRAIEIEPNNAKFYDSRSATYHAKGLYDEALADANKAIELEPNNARYYNNRGVTLHEMGRYDEAETDFQKAHELEGKKTP